jgi:hypothetical protein
VTDKGTMCGSQTGATQQEEGAEDTTQGDWVANDTTRGGDGQCGWLTASGGGSGQRSMVLARGTTNKVSSYVWVHWRWLDAAHGGGGGLQSRRWQEGG